MSKVINPIVSKKSIIHESKKLMAQGNQNQLTIPSQESMAPLNRRGIILAVIANTLWGMSFIASKITIATWSPFTATCLRFLLAILLMIFLFPFLGLQISLPTSRKQLFAVFGIGLTGFGFLYPLQLAGLSRISSSFSASIMLTSPLFVLILASSFSKEELNVQKWVSILLGIIGGCILLLPNSLTSLDIFGQINNKNLLTGSILTFGASVSLACSVVITKSVSNELDSQSLTFWSIVAGILLLLPFMAIDFTNGRAIINRGDFKPAMAALFFLASICSVLCFYLWNKALSYTPAKDLASSMHIKTPVAVAIGTLYAHEPLTLNLVVGSLIIAFAVWLSQTERKRKNQLKGQ